MELVQINDMPDTAFLRLNQVLTLYPIGKTAWYLGIKDGRHPAPYRLAPRTSAYLVRDIKELLARSARRPQPKT